MPVQSQLFSDTPERHPPTHPPAQPASPPSPQEPASAPPAPLWLQRLSLFILVVFCIYLGVIVTVLPWWSVAWDRNPVLAAYPRLAHILRLGPIRGIISGLGLLDIWIGISEAIHYRDRRN